MKRITNIIVVFTLLFLYGCEQESYRSFEESQVKIDKSDVVFTAAGGTGTIVVASSEQFTASVDQSWCTINTSGNTITVTVGPNMSNLTRSANISIKAKDKINFVPVSQSGVYIHLDSYKTVVFLGKGGNISLPYECDAPVTVTGDAPWVTGYSQGGQIVLQATQNPAFLESRSTKITLTAGNNLTSLKLDVLQGEAITSADPDPDVDAVGKFLNLKNNNGTSSRYKVTLLSSSIETYRANLKTAFPIFQEIRIEAPRSTYGASVFLYNEDDGPKYYYWNCNDGLARLNGSNYAAAFMRSGNSVTSGWTLPYSANTNYTALQSFFDQGGGFMIFPDEDDVFWFRSITNPSNWFKAEPTQW